MALTGYATQREVAAFLHVNPRTLRRWHEAGTGPPRADAGRKPYDWREVTGWTKTPTARLHGINPAIMAGQR